MRQMRITRSRLRILRKNPNPERGGSEAPSRMERSDAPRQVAVFDLVETGTTDHFGQLALPRETRDTLDEIGISIAIARDDLAEQRHQLKAVEVVERLQKWCDFGRELQAEKPPARPQNSACLGERHIDPGNVSQPEPDRIEVHAAVGDGETLGVRTNPLDPAKNALIKRAIPPNRQHRIADIANHDTACLSLSFSDEVGPRAQRDITGSASNIEKMLTRPRL